MDDFIFEYHNLYEEHLNSCNNEEKVKKSVSKQGINQKYNSDYYDKKGKIYKGDENAIKYRTYISTIKNIELFDFQEATLDQFFRVSVPQLYWDDWDFNSKEILKMYFGETKEYKFQQYKTARKEGKTFVSTLHAIALALSVSPRSEPFLMAFCSLALENATEMLSKAFMILDHIIYDKQRIGVNYHIKKMEIYFYSEDGKYIGKSILKPKQSGTVKKFNMLLYVFFIFYVAAFLVLSYV